MMPPDVVAWLDRQDEATRRGVGRLRDIVRSVDARWTETIKWNAPSFALAGEDRVTLGVERGGGWRVVLHRGAGVRDDGFAFDDPSGLADWPAPDRGVVRLRDLSEVEDRAEALAGLIHRWVAATA